MSQIEVGSNMDAIAFVNRAVQIEFDTCVKHLTNIRRLNADRNTSRSRKWLIVEQIRGTTREILNSTVHARKETEVHASIK